MPEAQTETQQQETKTPPAGGTQQPPPGAPPVGTPPAPLTQQHKQGTPATQQQTTTEQQAPKQPRALGPDDEPEDGEEFVLKASDFKKRMERDRKKLLKELHGTDNEATIRERLTKAKELEAKADEQRRAELSEQARLKEDLEKEKSSLTAAQQRIQELEDQREIDAEEKRISVAVAQYIKPKFLKHAFIDFADHLTQELSPEEQDAMTDVQIHEWFKQYAIDNPELAAAAPPTETQQQQTQTRVPASNGHRQQMKPQPLPSGTMQGKTPRPGQPNSMTPQEYREYKAQRGMA